MAKRKSQDTDFSLDDIIDGWLESALDSLLVYVEGPEDVKIYREIALLSGASPVSFDIQDSGGGRNALFQLFERWKSIGTQLDRPILFFADQDLYVFGQVPEAYAGIYFTHGYSIENDLFCDGETLLMAKLRPEERERFAALLDSVCAWFGHAKDQQPPLIEVNLRSEQRIAPGSSALDADFMAERGFLPAGDARFALLRTNFSTHLRGKFLFQLLWRIMLDREAETLRITHEHALWLDCIAEGLLRDGSHCRSIATVIRRVLPARAA